VGCGVLWLDLLGEAPMKVEEEMEQM
jgi:hypothetical protein